MSLRVILARAAPGQGKAVKQAVHPVSRRTAALSTNTFEMGSSSSVLLGQAVLTQHAPGLVSLQRAEEVPGSQGGTWFCASCLLQQGTGLNDLEVVQHYA